MEKYPGPGDSQKKIERSYKIGLAIGLSIILVGVVGSMFGLAISGVEVLDPRARTGDQGQAVREIDNTASPIIGFAGILVGSLINFRAIYKYNRDVGSLQEHKPRTGFIVIGLVITVIFIVSGSYTLLLLFM